MLLDDEELRSVVGGANVSVLAGVGAVIAFLISVVDGFFNPSKCLS